jgi:hypothetical protein
LKWKKVSQCKFAEKESLEYDNDDVISVEIELFKPDMFFLFDLFGLVAFISNWLTGTVMESSPDASVPA